MAATITLELNDTDVVESINDITRAMQKGASAADNLSESAKRVSDTMDDVGDKAKKADESSRMTAMATGISAAIDAGKMLGQVFQSVRQKISELAADGIPTFERLDAQIKSTGDAWNNLLAQGVGGGAGGGGSRHSIGQAATDWGEALESLFDTIAGTSRDARQEIESAAQAQKTLDAVARTMAQREASTNIARIESLSAINDRIQLQRDLIQELERTSNQTDEQRLANAQTLLSLENQRIAILERRKAFEQSIEDIHNAQAVAAEENGLKQIKSHAEINAMIQEQIAAIREANATDSASFKEREQMRERLIRLEKRSQEIIQENTEAIEKQKKAEEDAFKAKKDARDKELSEWIKFTNARIAEEQRLAKEAAKLQKQRIDAMAQKFSGGMKGADLTSGMLSIEQKAQADILRVREQATQAYVTGDVKGFFQARQEEYRILAEALKAQKELRDRFRKEGGITDQIKSGFGQQDVLNQVIEGRQSKAMDEFIKDKGYASSTGDRRKQLQAEWKRMEKEIARQANRDFRAGRIGQDEADKATQELTNKTIDAAQKSGKFSQDTIAAMRQAADAAQTQSEQLQSHDEELQNISEQIRQVQEQLNETAQAGGRRRAQSK